jgi:hypothetical protein
MKYAVGIGSSGMIYVFNKYWSRHSEVGEVTYAYSKVIS